MRLAYDFIQAGPIEARAAAHRAGANRLLPFPAENPVVGWVGRITPFKQPDLFVEAASQVLSAVPQARFVVVGSASERDRAYEAQVKELARRSPHPDNIAFLGSRNDVFELLTEMSLLCVTSTYEPLGRVILEAQLARCPVIAPTTGGAPEIVSDGRTGIQFDTLAADAPDCLARSIIQLLDDRPLRQRLAANASEQVRRTFAGPEPVRRLEQILRDLAVSNGHSFA